MKKLVMLAVGAILLLGVVAVVAVLLLGGGDDVPPHPTSGTPAAVQPSGPIAPALQAVEGPSPAAPVPGPRRVLLQPARVKKALSEPLAGCFKSHPVHSSLPAILTLELEAQAGGGFAVVGSSVKAWGGATKGLVECAQRTLPGQVVSGGSFPAGERAAYDFALEPPPSIAPPPPAEPPPTTLPTSRQPPARRSGGSR